ncbi:MAG: hypothetical protein HKP08_12000 [Flavobacteriaceae bacterium]|nr:hypothetical protein [Flavobacteriaceae bacterium]
MRKVTYILILALILGCSGKGTTEKSLSVSPLEIPETIIAGQDVVFRFKIKGESEPKLLLSNSMGKSILVGRREGEQLTFRLPAPYSRKTGLCRWFLVGDNTTFLSGELRITNAQAAALIETYLGPGNIYAGGADHSMLVSVPVDIYDNPLQDSTEIVINTELAGFRNSEPIATNKLISWQRFFSADEASRMFLSVASGESRSKELTVDIHPAIPTDFNISYARNHNFADGNQLVAFSTSVLRDVYDNVVSDGTTVTFLITNEVGIILKTQGSTINGIAKAGILHPERPGKWKVQGIVAGAAESPVVTFDFLPAIRSFQLDWDRKAQSIRVGPVSGFLDQIQPEGLKILVDLFDSQGNIVGKFSEILSEGTASVNLSSFKLLPGSYQVKADLGGTIRELNIDIKDE